MMTRADEVSEADEAEKRNGVGQVSGISCYSGEHRTA